MNRMFSIDNRQSTIDNLVRGAICGLMLTFTACSQLIAPDTPQPIQARSEPETGREYLLYRPSSYDRAHSWPLIVLCHSGYPDSAKRQVEAWATLAEEYGFLMIAPKLNATKNAWSRSRGDQPQRQKEDEAAILASLRHVRAGHNLSDDRIMIHGSSGGAPSALFTGLRNGEVFRAISLVQPRFDRADMSEVTLYIDPHQPVYLNFRGSDVLTGKMGQECGDWLRSYGADLRIEPGSSGDVPQRTIEFFQDVIRKEAWIHVRAVPAEPANPLALRFKLLTSSPPARYRWQFSDGDESPVAEPLHVFPKPGKHRVVVTVEWPKIGEHTRYVDVDVPTATVRPAHGPP